MAGAVGLTCGDGEFGPFDGLPELLAESQCGQPDSAEVLSFILFPQVRDSEEAAPLALCPVQEEAVLEILMGERRACVVDELSIEVFPSPGYSHFGILGNLPGKTEGEEDVDGATLRG